VCQCVCVAICVACNTVCLRVCVGVCVAICVACNTVCPCVCVGVCVAICVACNTVCPCVCVIHSAADEYILRHFDKVITEARVDVKLLRLCDTERNVRTIDSTVQKYCLMTSDKRHFVLPTLDDIKRHHIIVTTLVTSLGLHRLCVSGLFTHIFVDEAAQVTF